MTQQAKVLFSGPFHTSYSQIYIESAELDGALIEHDPFEGHVNGLVGGAVPGGLYVTVGVHTGELQLSIELHDVAPSLDDAWEDVVETSFVVTQTPVYVQGCCGGSYAHLADLKPGVYRVRYCARAYGQFEQHRIESEQSGEAYALLLWPQAWQGDLILKGSNGHSRRRSGEHGQPSAAMLKALERAASAVPEADHPVEEVAASAPPPPPWRASLDPWGMPHYLSAQFPGHHDDIGPVAIGRVAGSERVAAGDACGRILAADVHARLPVPSLPLAAFSGDAILSGDTWLASAEQPVVLEKHGYMTQTRSIDIHPFSVLPSGMDAVLEKDSASYKGTRISDKFKRKIIQPVYCGNGVVGVGADLQADEILFNEGRRIGPGDVAVLCMAGIAHVSVVPRPRVALFVIDKYFHKDGGEGVLPDAVTPMVLALLARWGIKVDTVHRTDFTGRAIDNQSSAEIAAVAAQHDLTLTLGYLGNKQELTTPRGTHYENGMIEQAPIAPPVPGLDWDLTRDNGLFRPADIARLSTGRDKSLKSDVGNCQMIIGLRGLPLSVLASMYMLVKPTLDALCGVGAYPVMGANHLRFGSPLGRGFGNEERRAFLRRSEPGMSARHGVTWYTGVLAAPAPRDRERHWLQLARVGTTADGRMGLQVLPSEEYQVRGLISANAMVAIEKGEGALAAGTVVEYFLLD
jgi:molybdopterin biosynthesis enzyme